MSRASAASPPTRRTRLVATIGPASVELVGGLVEAGLDVARINLSHGLPAEHLRAAQAIRSAAAEAHRTVAILVDLPGPKLRLADLPDGGLGLETGSTVTLAGPQAAADESSLPLAETAVLARLRRGDRILLADGEAELGVTSAHGDHVSTEVVRGGRVASRQGVNVPAERLAADAVGRSDEALIPHLLELEPDFVGQSFVRSADDVEALRARLPSSIHIVAKIETRPAVEAIGSILEVADAIMVARGDLGVELPFEQVPLVQKDLVRAALAAGRPSIVATQMLESMVEAPRPTRAEASDVANAVLDGADAVMLSGETAIGAWPLEALRAAAGICAAVDARQPPSRPSSVTAAFEADPDARAVAVAAITIVDVDPDVAGLACYTRTGRTARLLSALRPGVPIVAFTPTSVCARSLALRRGVEPVVLDVDVDDPAAIADAVSAALAGGITGIEPAAGRAVVLVQTSSTGGTNSLEVLRP